MIILFVYIMKIVHILIIVVMNLYLYISYIYIYFSGSHNAVFDNGFVLFEIAFFIKNNL